MDGSQKAVEVRGLKVAYDAQPVLRDVSFWIPQGSLAAVVGPNGAGKSTLIKAVLGLLRPLSGTVVLRGAARAKKPEIAYVPQSSSVDWDFPVTVLDVVMMGRYGRLGWLRRPGRAERETALAMLERVGMRPYAARHISRLSGGQRQREFLARALAQEAEIYLLDEPFKGVDARTESVILSLLQELKRQGKTAVVVHHDLRTVAEYFDWVVLMNTRVVASGAAAQVLCETNLRRAYAGWGDEEGTAG